MRRLDALLSACGNDFQAIQIERYRKKRPIVDVDEMTARQISGIVTIALYDLGHASRQGLNNDVRVIPAATR